VSDAAAARARIKPHVQRMNMLPEGWMWEMTVGGMRYVAWTISALSFMAQSIGGGSSNRPAQDALSTEKRLAHDPMQFPPAIESVSKLKRLF
jgi:hypothetical protein